MGRDWENTFKQWTKPPDKTEEERSENAIKAIRNAIHMSGKFSGRSIKVFTQGSYRNRVNVRKESDVDVGVLCDDSFLSRCPEGTTIATFGYSVSNYTYTIFKDEIEKALVDYFGRASVHRGNKAFDVRENSHQVEADVVPFFEYRHFEMDGSYRCGVALNPDRGGIVHNYPERLLNSWPQTPLHYENGNAKNTATSRCYRGAVRILKSLRNEMEDYGHSTAKPIPGFLLESMAWNVPDRCFRHDTWDGVIQAVLVHLWSHTKDDEKCDKWTEVNDIKFLFHVSQKWTRDEAYAFINSAWDYVGVRS